jgi:Arc/MetJ-type ribon-helix-helix transcriptional regulator
MADTEKITINMSPVDLGRIDLLVQEGFYSSRTDFIRTAIRNQLDKQAETVDQVANRREMVIGTLMYNRKDLETFKVKKVKVNIKVIGLFILTQDVTPELALATIDSVTVHGGFKAPEDVKVALADRIR